MANRWALGLFIAVGMSMLTGCTSVQTTSERQTYFENTSTARLAWQPMPNESTSFQGCSWDSDDYPCQPYSKLTIPKQDATISLKRTSSATTSHKKVSYKKKAVHAKALPLCQPVPYVNAQVKSDENNSVQPHKTNT